MIEMAFLLHSLSTLDDHSALVRIYRMYNTHLEYLYFCHRRSSNSGSIRIIFVTQILNYVTVFC